MITWVVFVNDAVRIRTPTDTVWHCLESVNGNITDISEYRKLTPMQKGIVRSYLVVSDSGTASFSIWRLTALETLLCSKGFALGFIEPSLYPKFSIVSFFVFVKYLLYLATCFKHGHTFISLIAYKITFGFDLLKYSSLLRFFSLYLLS